MLEEYKFSNLKAETLQKIKSLEEELNQNSKEELILLAYNKK